MAFLNCAPEQSSHANKLQTIVIGPTFQPKEQSRWILTLRTGPYTFWGFIRLNLKETPGNFLACVNGFLCFIFLILTIFDLAVWSSHAGMSSAASSGSYPSSGERGKTHHPSGQEPPPATVGPAGVRVCAHHTGCGAESSRPPLQQLERTVPEHIGKTVCGVWLWVCLVNVSANLSVDTRVLRNEAQNFNQHQKL